MAIFHYFMTEWNESMIDSRPLRHLLAVANHSTVQAAAESLHLTQSALTKSLARFEEAIGVQLFDRRGHKLELTEFGHRLVARSEKIVRGLHDIQEDVSLWKGMGVGEVVIGVDAEAELNLLPAVLEHFVPVHPDVELTIRSGHTHTLLAALLAGEIHFFVADAELAHGQQDLLIQSLGEEQLAPAVRPAHPLAGQDDITALDLAAYPLVGSSTAPRFERWREERGNLELGRPFTTSLLCGNFEVLVRLVEQSDAVLFGPHKLLTHYEAAGRLKVMSWPLESPSIQTSLVRLRDRPLSPAASLIADIFLQISTK
jgi:DNA-binding transcriptional LysR family regulator